MEDHSFTPSNSKLISVFLRCRIASEPLPAAAAAHFHEADIYAAEPATLTAGLDPVPAGKGEASSWLFFTHVKTKSTKDSRRCRRVGDGVGTWHSEHAPEAVVDDEGKRVGHRQLFSYKDKGGKRSGWSMWEFSAADQEGAESLLVLCKIHQPKTASRRADGSAARSARKRKAADDGIDQVSAFVKRRLFAPPAPPTPPAASQDKIGAASDSEAIPCSRTETEESEDVPGSVLSLWDDSDELAAVLGPIKPSSRLGCSFPDPDPEALREKIISTTMESPATFLIPQPEESQDKIGAASEVIPCSRTETEKSKDAPGSALSFWDDSDELATVLGPIKSSSRLACSFSDPDPDASRKKIISTTMESPDAFLIPQPEESQAEMASFNCGLQMESGAPPVPENFMDCSSANMSGAAPAVELSGSWNVWSCSPGGNAFLGGLPTQKELGVETSGSWTGYNATASCTGRNTLFGDFPDQVVSGFAGVQYGCAMPSATFLPSTVTGSWRMIRSMM